jgi:hypothetical protein
MFTQLYYLWRLFRLNRTLTKAADAVKMNNVELAAHLIERGFELERSMILPRTALINSITGWGLMGVRLEEMGATDLANRCYEVAKILQMRFDAGDYRSDPSWVSVLA